VEEESPAPAELHESNPESGGEAESEAEPEAEPQAAEGDYEGEHQSLKFNEELSWRPAKPIPSGTLLTRLEKLSKELADFEQGEVDLSSLKDVSAQLAHRNLLQHKDRGVKAYTACCLVDILRLFVPDAPFTDDQLKVGSPSLGTLLAKLANLIPHR
jgi:sister-chromatid-cohesion protein PDS5